MHVLTIDYTAANSPELFSQSLKETGFAVIKNHDFPEHLIKQAYQQWREFFNSPHKHDYLYNRETHAGYFPFRSENAKGQKVSDLKEFFHYYVGRDVPAELHDITLELHQHLTGLAGILLQWIENYLPPAIAQQLSFPLKDMIVGSRNILLRILHYPPLQGSEGQEAIRAAAHEDINLITLLPAATAPGLEVLDAQGNWHAVGCEPGNIVVNVGDMLQECTQHCYKSTTHRVVNPANSTENCSRYSMPLFLHPRDEVSLSSRYTALEYKMQRYKEIGLY